MQEKEGMLEASPASGGAKAACLLINSKNIRVQMLMFFPCRFPLQNVPSPNCSAALPPLAAEGGSASGAWQSQRLPGAAAAGQPPPQKGCQEPEQGLPREGKTGLYLLGETGSDNRRGPQGTRLFLVSCFQEPGHF